MRSIEKVFTSAFEGMSLKPTMAIEAPVTSTMSAAAVGSATAAEAVAEGAVVALAVASAEGFGLSFFAGFSWAASSPSFPVFFASLPLPHAARAKVHTMVKRESAVSTMGAC